MFFKGHIEKIRIDVYNLGKTEVILDMLWLAAYNPEIDWKKEEKNKEVRKIEEEKTVEELVPKRFWKWKKMFGKAESERMLVQKT